MVKLNGVGIFGLQGLDICEVAYEIVDYRTGWGGQIVQLGAIEPLQNHDLDVHTLTLDDGRTFEIMLEENWFEDRPTPFRGLGSSPSAEDNDRARR